MGPLVNGALCLSTPRHNGKSGTAFEPSKCNKIITSMFKLHKKCIAEHLPMSVWNDNTNGANDDNNVNNQEF